MSRQLAGTYSGIGYSLALLAWFMMQLYAGVQPAAAAAVAIQGLLVTQYLLIAVITPWLAQGGNSRSIAADITMLCIVPLPLLLVLVQSSATASPGIWLSQALAACLAAFNYLVARTLLACMSQGRSRYLAIGALQILTATLVWAGRGYWLRWLTS